MNIKTYIVLLICIFSLCSQAGIPKFSSRYIIPKDKDVLTHFGLSSETELDPYSMKVLVWNIYKGKKARFAKDFNTLVMDKDLVLVQEGYLNSSNKLLLQNTGLDYFFATSFLDTKYGSYPTGVSTGSRAKATGVIWQRSFYREPIIKTPKMTLFTRYKLYGQSEELLVGNIHGVNFVKAYKLRHMLDQAAKVLGKHSGPAIFGGDFNTWTKTKLNNLNSVMKKIGFVKVKFKGNPKAFLGKPLDHVYIKNLKVLEAIIPSDIFGSDHKPLELELSI